MTQQDDSPELDELEEDEASSEDEEESDLVQNHLVISLWAVVIGAIGLKRILAVPTWLGVLLSFLGIPIALPFGIMFMRSPL